MHNFNMNYATKATANADYIATKAQGALNENHTGENKPDLRSAHFTFGNEGTAYVSSYKDCHKDESAQLVVPDGKEPTQKERVAKARQQ